MYQPKTGYRCTCRPGIIRDNCPSCEGTGWQIDFARIHKLREAFREGHCLNCGERSSEPVCPACRGAA